MNLKDETYYGLYENEGNKVYERIINKRSVEEDLLSISLRKKLSSFEFGIKNHWFSFNTYKIKHQLVGNRRVIDFSNYF